MIMEEFDIMHVPASIFPIIIKKLDILLIKLNVELAGLFDT